ncbi:hypothetical protein GALMADRAFT_21123, partial [Galerina marginata CBS 339.88]
HGIQGALIEGKVERLISAIDEVMALKPLHVTVQPSDPADIPCNVTEQPAQIPIDVDALPDVETATLRVKKKAVPMELPKMSACSGVLVETPVGMSPYSAYPFELHKDMGDPWDCVIVNGQLTAHARGCEKHISGQKICKQCELLSRNTSLLRIVDRMREGIHRNAPFAYHSTAGLINIVREKSSQINSLRLRKLTGTSLRKLNDTRKIVAKAGALDAHKDWIMAIGSGKVER